MSLAGEGAVAIWHDIADGERANFYAWHGQEHMPERVGIPGFLRGRRYGAIDAPKQFFNLYEAQTLETLKGQDYAARVNAPTPWTLRTVRAFQNTARSICRVLHSSGKAQGGLIATLDYDLPVEKADEHLDLMRRGLLPDLLAREGVAGVHLLAADAEASGIATAEQKARGVANAVPRWILLVEGWGDEAEFIPLARKALAEQAFAGTHAERPFTLGLYRHQTTRTKTGWSAG